MSSGMKEEASWHASYTRLLFIKIFNRVPQVPQGLDLGGKTAVITGASSGLGLECSRQLLDRGLSSLVIAVRSQTKGDAAAHKLRIDFPKANIQVWLVDMLSYPSIQEFASRCETLPRLDIAILNAGVVRSEFERSNQTGHEANLQVNYLSTALLAILLLPKLRAKMSPDGVPGRLTIVASGLALLADLPNTTEGQQLLTAWDQVNEKFNGVTSYSQSKLLVVMFVAKLASDFVSDSDVIVNTVNPSAVKNTDVSRETDKDYTMYIANKIMMFVIGRGVSEGARTYVYASSVLGKESHGSLCDWIVRPYPIMMYTEAGREKIEKVWYETMQELEFAKVKSILEGMRREDTTLLQ